MSSRLACLSLVGTAFLAGCVSVEENPRVAASAVKPGQRTLVVVYPAPGPWVVPEPDSKAATAAKTLPGFSQVVSAFQEDRGLKEAQDLKPYLPRWNPGPLMTQALMKELPMSAFIGRFTEPGEEFGPAAQKHFNRASDTLAWQRTFFYEDPEARGLARNYASLMALDDALILEVNLLYGVTGDGEGNMIPDLTAVSRLVRANTGRVLWRHENTIADAGGARTMYEFKTLPKQLTDFWEKLMPTLATQITASLRAALEVTAPPVIPVAPQSDGPPAPPPASLPGASETPNSTPPPAAPTSAPAYQPAPPPVTASPAPAPAPASSDALPISEDPPPASEPAAPPAVSSGTP